MENVKNLVGSKFIDKFKTLNKEFEDIGYNVYYQVINAKNCGVPQNRERVFGVYIRKDIDTKNFTFPKPFDTGIRLKHILEKEIDSKYYLSQKIQDRFILTDKTFSKNVIGTTKPSCRKIGQRDVVYNTEKIIGTLVATDCKQPKQILLKEDNNCKQIGFLDVKGYFDTEKRVYNTENIYPTITTHPRAKIMPSTDVKSIPHIRNTNLSVRKLTPIESFRLMGLTKEDALACYNIGESDSSLYKQAGNGLVSNCITLLLEHLYKAQVDNTFVCTDESINNRKEN
jgi:DNA (cytosine-5)-methyltransferase 1